MVLVDEMSGEHLDSRIQVQHLLDQRGQFVQLVDQGFLVLGRQSIAPRQRNGQQRERRQLGRERLGRGNTNLLACPRHHDEVGFAHQRAFGHVADRQG